MAYFQNKRQSRDDFDTKVIEITRVTRVAAGGKHMSFRAVLIGGDKKGRVGIGIGKGLDVAQAVEKATKQIKKSLVVIPMRNDTIPHEVHAKFGPSEVVLKPQAKGRGLVAGGPVRVICQMAGLKNISAKFVSTTHNKLNNAMAVFAALNKLKLVKPFNEHATPSTSPKA